MELKKIIEKKDFFAKYMIDEITHICKTFEKRDPGSNGEKQACEYMADVLKNDCGCDRVSIESFKENPGSFFGWIYFTITFVLAAVALFFVLPVLSIQAVLSERESQLVYQDFLASSQHFPYRPPHFLHCGNKRYGCAPENPPQ